MSKQQKQQSFINAIKHLIKQYILAPQQTIWGFMLISSSSRTLGSLLRNDQCNSNNQQQQLLIEDLILKYYQTAQAMFLTQRLSFYLRVALGAWQYLYDNRKMHQVLQRSAEAGVSSSQVHWLISSIIYQQVRILQLSRNTLISLLLILGLVLQQYLGFYVASRRTGDLQTYKSGSIPLCDKP